MKHARVSGRTIRLGDGQLAVEFRAADFERRVSCAELVKRADRFV